MRKFIFALIACAFSISALACPSDDGIKEKEKKPEERISSLSQN